ncbi:uncharacterized protein LOC111623901 [Centruroides sculpturatus]|uniref:uncharacterized protein LOC111623901 n=1 Tax=Centruroides sculpturatus TaxID=218467 RepID=UPI000C6E826C|nr:uncharacterized protein LOC111623901 [Centruroides sculpturatus]
MFAVTLDAVTMNIRGKSSSTTIASSPENVMASEIFDQFVSAGTFKSVLSTYRQLCEVLRLKPTNFPNFYPKLKAKLHSWKAASLWAKLDKRASHKCYNRGKACTNTRVLIIGAGPCGLRTAIESQLLGAKVVVVEKRDRFSRNNVLHLWPFVIHDLRNLGAKKFFGKFCAGSIDHISIRQLQLILLKVALLLGVEVHENVTFKSLLQPTEDDSPYERVGWHAEISPSDHPVSQYEFDVLIGADGKRNTLLGFNRKEFRGKLAIAITANFINRHSLEEAQVLEISGVAFIFNQKFFQDMKEETGIDLENVVYYKDDTHYFVMTAKKQSLLDRGVILKDYNDTARLLASENIDREALMDYARDAANFSTNNQLPSTDFAVNHYGQADVAMFDFTSMYAAENASRIIERKGYKLLQGLVGDSLLEPFWPTGSGCARGFLSALDAAWMIRSWASGKMTPLQVLAERESIYRLLAQTTPENLNKNFNQNTLNPSTRYPNLVTHAILPAQLRPLYDTDKEIKDELPDIIQDVPKKRKRRDYAIHPDALLVWCQKQVALYDDIKIIDMTSSWKNGMALCAIIHRYRPDLIDLRALNPEDISKNNQLAFDICEREYGIPPVMTGQEMSECNIPDKLTMVSYISQIYEIFRGEIPYTVRPIKPLVGEDISGGNQHQSSLSIFSKLSQKFQVKRGYSLERESKDKEKTDTLKRSKTTNTLSNKRKSKERDKGIALEIEPQDVALKSFKKLTGTSEKASFNTRVRDLEEKMRKDAGLRSHHGSGDSSSEVSSAQNKTGKRATNHNIKLLEQQLRKESIKTLKSDVPKVGKLSADDWNIKQLEQTTRQSKITPKITNSEAKSISQDIFNNKLKEIDKKLSGEIPNQETALKFKKIDASLQNINHKLKTGYLDTGDKRVTALTELISNQNNDSPKKLHTQDKTTTDSTPSLQKTNIGTVGGSEICYFCQKRVYIMERLSAEGLFFHRSCLKCEYCGVSLRLGNYAFDRTALCGGKFYCKPHFRMQKPDSRWQEMMKRKQAFLSGGPDAKEIFSTIAANALAKTVPSPEKPAKEENADEIDTTENHKPEISIEETPSPSLLPPPVVSVSLRDQTPERVEYENSLIELSEEELLTSELEEEELTQKNLGVGHELETSDDEFSDLSTDTESEEEAFAEELERSMTADETRRLAETWQQRYSQEGGFLDKSKSSSSSSSSSPSEGSETEIGSDDTSEDIDSDEEYSFDDSAEDDDREAETPIESKEVVVQVPVIDLKNWKGQTEDSSTEVDTSDITDTDLSKEGTDTETESDSDSELNKPAPPQQIPTIVIEESPPQEESELVWGEVAIEENITTVKDDNYSNIIAKDNINTLSNQTNQESVLISDEDASLIVNIGDAEQILSSPSSTDRSSHRESPCKDKIIMSDNLVETFETLVKTSVQSSEVANPPDSELYHFEKEVKEIEKSLSQEDLNLKEIALEIVENIVSEAKDILNTSKYIQTVVPSENKNIISEKMSSEFVLPLNIPVQTINSDRYKIDENEKPTDTNELKKVPSEKIKTNESDSEQIPLLSPLTLPLQNENDLNNLTLEIMNTPSDSSTSNRTISSESYSSDLYSHSEQVVKVGTPDFVKLVSSDDSEISPEEKQMKEVTDIITDNRIPEENSNVDFNYNPSFITLRDKTKRKNDSEDIYSWDSDNSDLPLPWYVNSLEEAGSDNLSQIQGVYRADVIQCVDNTSNADDDYNQDYNSSTVINEVQTTEEKLQNIEPNIAPTNFKETEQSKIIDKEKILSNSTEKFGKFHGYSGSFAEKIRPKSFVGDSIYLKSLNINLQKLDFPSVTRSLEKLNINQKCNLSETSLEDDKMLKNRNSNENYFSSESKSSDNLVIENDKSVTPVMVRFASSTPINNLKNDSEDLITVTNSDQQKQDSGKNKQNWRIPNYTAESVQAVHSRVKDQNKSTLQKRFRKSIHEDIEGVPFADDKENSDIASIRSATPPEFFTPVDTSKGIREQCTADLEKARKEARERARLKSDEELGLSPYNYRKRYHKHPPSINSFQYEELLQDNILDSDDDDGEDDYFEETQHEPTISFHTEGDTLKSLSVVNSKDNGITNLKISPMSSSEEGTGSNPSQTNSSSIVCDDILSPSVDTVSSDKNTTTASSTSRTDAANYLESSLSIDEIDIKLSPEYVTKTYEMQKSPPVLQNSSETSPEILDNSLNETKKIKYKQKLFSPGDVDERGKNGAKKSLFSLLNFTKNGNNKDKSKIKSKDNSKETSSLITDYSKTPPKLRSFPHLKLPRSKERNREKQRKKYQALDKVENEAFPNLFVFPSVSISSQHAKSNKLENVRKSLEKLTMKSSPAINQPINLLKVENGVAPKASGNFC